MSKKPKKKKDTTVELPAMEGPGVEILSIPEIDSAARKYQKQKDARYSATPGELAAKADLTATLQAHRDKLPTNAEGKRYYRYDGVEYLLDEVLKVHKADDDSGATED